MAEDDPLAIGRGPRKFEEVDDGTGNSGYHPPMPANVGKRERSCYLQSDPKMRELKHYIKSHRHEGRLRTVANLEQRPQGAESPKSTAAPAPRPQNGGGLGGGDGGDSESRSRRSSLRMEGRDAVDWHMKRLATEKATVPPMGSNGDTSDARRLLGPAQTQSQSDLVRLMDERRALLQRNDRFHTRLQWRKHMDHSLRRLLVDMDLARTDQLKAASHNLRCDHLDKVFCWYAEHGKKESRKEKEAPPYVKYSNEDPVMPGSLRVARHAWRGGAEQGLGRSSSSPALLANGAGITGTGSVAGGGELDIPLDGADGVDLAA